MNNKSVVFKCCNCGAMHSESKPKSCMKCDGYDFVKESR